MISQGPVSVVRPAIGFLVGLLIAGCAATAPPPSPSPDPSPVAKPRRQPKPPDPEPQAKQIQKKKAPNVKPFIHTVRWPGETLSVVAKWYTGRHANWKAVAKANPELNPHRIFVGSEIVIPKGMLTTRKPMPRNFVATAAPKKKKAQAGTKTKKASSDPAPLPLFGPKGR